MGTKNRPAIGRLLLGTLFVSFGTAAIVAGTSNVDWGPSLGLALVAGGAVALGALLYGSLRSGPVEIVADDPAPWTPIPDPIRPSDEYQTDDEGALGIDETDEVEGEPDLLEQAALLDDTY